MKEAGTDWYKDGVIYELHVRSFYDSNRDGIGDFRGLTERLDYLKSLGVTVIWLLPFYPSPLKTQGHDITDFKAVHPNYGTIEEFQTFLDEAHRRGLKVVIDLVMNHTSNLHPWFERARRAAPGTPERDFYVWSDTATRFTDARVIYKDFESSNWSWDPVAGAYYWHRFFQHQPDLNFDNPLVHEALFDIVRFWLDRGVDGLRLKGAPYLYAREGTSCENLPEVHGLLRKLRGFVDRHYPGRILLGRAKLWAEDVVEYFGSGNECHAAFNFPLMPRMFMAVGAEDRFPIVDVFSQMKEIPKRCQWVNFLRDHDDLTLEMVTDEERDLMYRLYAKTPGTRVNLGIRRRLAPLMENNRRKIELMNGLLFSFPGTPVIYSGDEIGMGDNIYLSDRNGLRTPFQWSSSRNAGFSPAPNAHTLYLPVIEDPEYHYETVNVEAQETNPNSLLSWTRRLIEIHRQHRAFQRGSIEFLQPENRKVLAFIREHEGERILVIANLSSLAQYAELDLSRYAGHVPVELFGQMAFPAIGTLPYFLTLGPHAFYWFRLEGKARRRKGSEAGEPAAAPKLSHAIPAKTKVAELEDAVWNAIEKALPESLQRFRWFGGKSRPIRSVRIQDRLAVGRADVRLALLQVEYTSGFPDLYQLPMALAFGKEAAGIRKSLPNSVLLEFDGGLIYDAVHDPAFRTELLRTLLTQTRITGKSGTLQATLTRRFLPLARRPARTPRSEVLRGEQSNTSISYGNELIFKLYRRLEEGSNPDVEIGRYLTDRSSFTQIAQVAGTLEFQRKDHPPMTLGSLNSFVKNEGDAWSVLLKQLLAAAPTGAAKGLLPALPEVTPLRAAQDAYPREVKQAFGSFLTRAELLGRRTMEMHLALAGDTRAARAADTPDPAFQPEAFTLFYQRALYQSMRRQTDFALNTLKEARARMPAGPSDGIARLLKHEEKLYARFGVLLTQKVDALRTRTHGDYHLGQVLATGRDFVIIDFEGEPARSLNERKFKRSPLRDVAGMLRSFHYASHVARNSLLEAKGRGGAKARAAGPLKSWLTSWHAWVCVAYLKGYLAERDQAAFLPTSTETTEMLLGIYLIEKALYELVYEINNRPDWLQVPLDGILELLEEQP